MQAAGCGAQGPGKAAFDCPVLKMTIDCSENAGIAVATNLYKEEDRSTKMALMAYFEEN